MCLYPRFYWQTWVLSGRVRREEHLFCTLELRKHVKKLNSSRYCRVVSLSVNDSLKTFEVRIAMGYSQLMIWDQICMQLKDECDWRELSLQGISGFDFGWFNQTGVQRWTSRSHLVTVHPPVISVSALFPVIFLWCFCSKGEFKAAVISAFATSLSLSGSIAQLTITIEGNLMEQLPWVLLHLSVPGKMGENCCRNSLGFLFS